MQRTQRLEGRLALSIRAKGGPFVKPVRPQTVKMRGYRAAREQREQAVRFGCIPTAASPVTAYHRAEPNQNVDVPQ
jgi:hypothetical protein